MSFVLHFWQFPIPHSLQEAERYCSESYARVGPQNPRFLQLARELTARYPCLCDFGDDDSEAVWVDGPLDGITDRGRYSLGIVTRHLDEVYPFVVETATSLGLVVYDFQSGETHLPCGMTVQGNEVMIGNHLGMPLAGTLTASLVERVLFDALLLILERLGFESNRALGGLWRSFGQGHQLLRFRWLDSTPALLSFDIELLITLNILKTTIEPMLASATLGQEKYVATAMSSLALFCLFYKMRSGLAKHRQEPLRFELRSVDELRVLAIELRLLAVQYLYPMLSRFEDVESLAYYLHSTKPDAWRIIGSRTGVDAEGRLFSETIARNLLDTERCGGPAVAILIAAVERLPRDLLQSIIDRAYEWVGQLSGEQFKLEKAKLSLCLSMLRQTGYYE